jgi:sugar phosphate isomerase/epimerase
MYKGLNPGAVGVKTANLEDAISKAKRHGFGGVEFNPAEVDSMGTDEAKALYEAHGILPCGWGLPVDWRTTEENWKDGLAELPRLAKAAAAIGGTRCSTWVLPMSDELPFDKNLAHHIERFKPIAEILGEHGCSLGLEFIGPKTLRDKGKHPFIYTMGDMLDMAQQIGPNVGLLLDCWHWYTSGGCVEEIEALTADKVVYVHLNDAPKDVDRDAQVDNVRCLPGETGVIDIEGFLKALTLIGYSGPVVAEPFKKELADLSSDDERLAVTYRSLDEVFKKVFGA